MDLTPKMTDIKLIRRLAEGFILFNLLVIFLSYWFADYIPTSSLGLEIRDMIVADFGQSIRETAARIAVSSLEIIILFSPFLLSIYLRNKIVLFISQLCLGLLVSFSIHSGTIPYSSLFFLLLTFSKPFRENFNSKKKCKVN